MSRIEAILKKARYSLADPAKERYSDERLLSALSEGQRDIARQTRLLKDEVDIVLELAAPIYRLPEDLWLITRATFNDEVIPLLSYDRMDDNDLGWYNRFGNKVEALVYDKRNMLDIRVYPRPDPTHISTEYAFKADNPLEVDPNNLTLAQLAVIHAAIAQLQVLDSGNPLDLVALYDQAGTILNITPAGPDQDAIFGVVTSVDGVTAEPLFGVLTDIGLDTDYKSWPGGVKFSSPFGVVTAIENSTGVLHINYIKDPADLATMSDELLVSPIFDAALKYYVIGQAYSDDLDSQYQAKAGDAMSMYKRELDTVGYPTDFTDGTRATQYTPNYSGPFGN